MDMIEIRGREDDMYILIQREVAKLERETHAPWITQSIGPTGFQFTRVDEEGYPDPELGMIPVLLVWED